MDFEVYCDESRQEYFGASRQPGPDQYVLIGSLWIEAARRGELKAKIKTLREAHDLHGEFKWNRVSPSRQQFYTSLVDLFFAEAMRFRCILLPASQLDAVCFHEGDNDLMFYKFYYLLLHQWILDFNRYRIFVDAKTNRVKQRLTHLKAFITRSNITSEIAGIQALKSHEVDLIQLVDVLTGAVGYHFNGGGTSAAKKSVVRAIERKLGHAIQPTPKTEEKFNIFCWHPGGGW